MSFQNQVLASGKLHHLIANLTLFWEGGVEEWKLGWMASWIMRRILRLGNIKKPFLDPQAYLLPVLQSLPDQMQIVLYKSITTLPSGAAHTSASLLNRTPILSQLMTFCIPGALSVCEPWCPTRQSGMGHRSSLKSCTALHKISTSDCFLQAQSKIRCYNPHIPSCDSLGNGHKYNSSHWQSSFQGLNSSLSLPPSCHLFDSGSRIYLK